MKEVHILQEIQNKRDGRPLSAEIWEGIVEGVVHDRIPDYQLAALLMAIFFQGLTIDELVSLTQAMARGERLCFEGVDRVLVDKHSTGGVGDKVSLVVCPLVAACGLGVPKISGRGLGFTGGTVDKLESIPGFRTELSFREMAAQLKHIGLFFVGQSEKISPADKKIYALRDVTGTVESIPLIVSSIVSKKIAIGAEAIVYDVKVGTGAFIKTRSRAKELAHLLIDVTEKVGSRRASALLTQMDRPLGKMIGNALEVKEAISVLKGKGPKDVEELSLEIASEMLLTGKAALDRKEARKKTCEALHSGQALEVFRKVIEAQKGNPRIVENSQLLGKAKFQEQLFAPRSGYVTKVFPQEMGAAVVALGGGRLSKGQRIDPQAGMEVHVKVGDYVEKKEPLLTLYYNRQEKGRKALRMGTFMEIGDLTLNSAPLILGRIRSQGGKKWKGQ